MKTSKILTCAIAATLAFAASKSLATDLTLAVSGSVKYQKTDTNMVKGTTSSVSFNDKTVYDLISNFVANASSYSSGTIAGTNLPAGGYIAFDPWASNVVAFGTNDVTSYGEFYVTNKPSKKVAAFYYPLQGHDANGNYYSWIELDTLIYYDYSSFLYLGPLFKGPVPFFDSVANYNLNSKGNGSASGASGAILYIHDDPYTYDDADNPYINYANYNPWISAAQGAGDDTSGENHDSIEIRGVLTSSFTFKTNIVSNENFSLTGTGKFYLFDYGYDITGVLTSGQATLSP